MQTVTLILILLAAVVVGSVVSRASRGALALPLVQIVLGAAIAQVFAFKVDLAPQTFLLLFIAPLLFLDGWRIPGHELSRDCWIILGLAFGLVLFTVLGAGLFVAWLLPTIPRPVAFALAAILSPTDAVALAGIAKRAPIPARLRHILEGESLLNDASGLVCLRFAIAASLSGTFSITQAATTLLWLAVAGSVLGVAVTLGMNAAKDWVARQLGEESGTQILVSLLIPFAAYLLADRLGASGILAAVAAGIAMGFEERAGRASAATRIRRAAVWDAAQFTANGTIFVLLGDQLPAIAAGAGSALRQTGLTSPVWLAADVILIVLVLLLLRALWVWAALCPWRADPSDGAPRWLWVAIASLAGVRGAVTLSAVMTLPLRLHDGSPFPTRDLVIFLAAGVIVVTLLVAALALPVLARRLLPPARAQARGFSPPTTRNS